MSKKPGRSMQIEIAWTHDTKGLFTAELIVLGDHAKACRPPARHRLLVERLPSEDGKAGWAGAGWAGAGWDWAVWASDGEGSSLQGVAPTAETAMRAAEQALERLERSSPVVLSRRHRGHLHCAQASTT